MKTDKTKSEFIRGMMDALEFAECGPDQDEELQYLAENGEWSDCAKRKIERIADYFLSEIAPHGLPEYGKRDYSDAEMAGHDYVMSRNGHGCGFLEQVDGSETESVWAACQNAATADPRPLYVYAAHGFLQLDEM